MWRCSCGYENSDIGNFCVACGTAKSAALSAQLSDDAAWFYYQGSRRFGPVSSHEIAGLLHAGELDRDTLVWKSGMNDWVPLHQTALNTLVPHLMPPPPLQAASDIFAWLLALMPMCVATFLSILRADKVGITLVIVLLTIFFWALDVWELDKTKNHLGAWIWTILLLTPAYLFIRSSKAGRRYGYAVAWCIVYACFVFIYAIVY